MYGMFSLSPTKIVHDVIDLKIAFEKHCFAN